MARAGGTQEEQRSRIIGQRTRRCSSSSQRGSRRTNGDGKSKEDQGQWGFVSMEIASPMSSRPDNLANEPEDLGPQQPAVPSCEKCGGSTELTRVVPGLGTLPELLLF